MATRADADREVARIPPVWRWLLANLAILAAIALAETFLFLLVNRTSDTFGDVVVGSLVLGGAIVYPYLLVGAAVFLAVLWRRGKRLPARRQRRLALLLSPLVGAPLGILIVLAGGIEVLPWYAAGTIAYGFLARVPAGFEDRS